MSLVKNGVQGVDIKRAGLRNECYMTRGRCTEFHQELFLTVLLRVLGPFKGSHDQLCPCVKSSMPNTSTENQDILVTISSKMSDSHFCMLVRSRGTYPCREQAPGPVFTPIGTNSCHDEQESLRGLIHEV